MIGSGVLLYTDVTDVVEAIVHTEGRKYPIPGLDFEDTAQEIRLECIRVLQFYNSERIGPSPYKFLQTCIRNFLYNQRRGIWIPNNPPCVRCPLWDKVNKVCVINEIGCEKIIRYRESMAKKAALKQPSPLEVEIIDSEQELELDAILLDESIRQALSTELVEYYEKMTKGERVPSKIKFQIREIVLQIINNA